MSQLNAAAVVSNTACGKVVRFNEFSIAIRGEVFGEQVYLLSTATRYRCDDCGCGAAEIEVGGQVRITSRSVAPALATVVETLCEDAEFPDREDATWRNCAGRGESLGAFPPPLTQPRHSDWKAFASVPLATITRLVRGTSHVNIAAIQHRADAVHCGYGFLENDAGDQLFFTYEVVEGALGFDGLRLRDRVQYLPDGPPHLRAMAVRRLASSSSRTTTRREHEAATGDQQMSQVKTGDRVCVRYAMSNTREQLCWDFHNELSSEFIVGAGETHPLLNLGVIGMRLGERRRLTSELSTQLSPVPKAASGDSYLMAIDVLLVSIDCAAQLAVKGALFDLGGES